MEIQPRFLKSLLLPLLRRVEIRVLVSFIVRTQEVPAEGTRLDCLVEPELKDQYS